MKLELPSAFLLTQYDKAERDNHHKTSGNQQNQPAHAYFCLCDITSASNYTELTIRPTSLGLTCLLTQIKNLEYHV